MREQFTELHIYLFNLKTEYLTIPFPVGLENDIL